MAASLPIDVLRSFVAIVDYGSMLKASERVFLTQSALSLQVKRLEEMLQQPLFHRDGRRLVLAPSGETLLQYAREMLALNDRAISAVSGGILAGPVRVGMVQDFAETLLTRILAQFAALHPEAALHARIGGTMELLDELAKDRLDVLIGFSEPGSKGEVRVEPMIWIGDPDLATREVAHLAVLEKPCRFREAAIAALEAAGRPYRIVLETPNLSTLRAGVGRGPGPDLPHAAVLFRRARRRGGRIAPPAGRGLQPLDGREPHPSPAAAGGPGARLAAQLAGRPLREATPSIRHGIDISFIHKDLPSLIFVGKL